MAKKLQRLTEGLFGVKYVKDDTLKEGKKPLEERPVYIDVSELTAHPEKYGYVVYATNVPPPLENLEPGSIVVCDYEGIPAKWMNGTIYVKEENLGKKE